MSKKDMKRSDWHRIVRKDYVGRACRIDGRQGRESLIIPRAMTAPLTVHYDFADVLVADVGYGWLQIALKDSYVWLTAMYDRDDKLVSLYFDITSGNCFDDPENPCFEDMYLDIVVCQGHIQILDEDELDEALTAAAITQDAYDHAKEVCAKLFAYLCTNHEDVIAWCGKSYRELKSQMG